MADASPDRWDGAAEYESYIGRWSRPVAERFVDWLDVPAGRAWLDVGCGTGALTAAIAQRAAPASVTALDLSAEFAASAANDLDDRRVVFLVGDARALPLADAQMDVVVSGLVLNFLADPVAAIAEWRRTARPGGTIAVFVWDYADAMEPIRAFWDAAIELAPGDGRPTRPSGSRSATRRACGARSATRVCIRSRRARSMARPAFATSTTTGRRSCAASGRRPATAPRCPRIGARCCVHGCTSVSRRPGGQSSCGHVRMRRAERCRCSASQP
jgi:SAM-dependent methyltransferase